MQLYKKYGFAATAELLHDAKKNRYAVPSLNFITMEQLNAIGDAIITNRSPAIIMVAPKHNRQFEIQLIVRMAQAMVERVREAGCGCPIALHLDHGNNFEECRLAAEHGFSSVMIDGSGLPLEENIKITREVAIYAHAVGVGVEGEVGALSGAEDADEENAGGCYTDPDEAERFVRETGVDCLAVSVGTMHGLNKTYGSNGKQFGGLRYDLIEEIERRIPDTPLVLHGCSSLPDKYIQMINAYGGKIEPTVGIPDECLRKASQTAVSKINIASDGWIPSTAITRKTLAEHPELIDSRMYREQIRKELTEIYKRKMDIFCSSSEILTKRRRNV